MKHCLIAAAVVVAGLVGIGGVGASTCAAQVVYAPVQYQYNAGVPSGTYYYGGGDPQVIAYANRVAADPRYRLGERYGFVNHKPINLTRAPVYSDYQPFVDFRPFNVSADDARNTAYESVPRYFRKSDQLNAAVQQPDGTLLVPATSSVAAPTSYSPLRPAFSGLPRGTIIIIPRQAVPARTPLSTGRKAIVASVK